MYQTILFIHILAGSLACICAAGALWVAKGRVSHKRWGTTYVAAMSVIALSAFVMSYLKPNVFLALIGVFTAFLLASGWVRAKNRTGTPSFTDWTLAYTGLGIGVLMVVVALYELPRLQVVLVVFGIITSFLALRDLYSLKKQHYKGAPRIAAHLSYMLGGTIANITAVLVVNWQSNPAWLAWLLPSVVIVPVIIYWNIKTLSSAKKS